MTAQTTSTVPVWRLQFVVALVLVGIFAATAVFLNLLARNGRLEAWVDRKGEDFARASGTAFTRDGYFVDDNDRLVNEELPAVDYSRGGVYLMGSSMVRAATKLWELPLEQRALIHNYGISQSDYTCQFLFLRHLVDHDGLLRAGGDKSLVIFGESYHNLSRKYAYDPNGYFINLWKRHGLYHCSPEDGIIPLAIHPARQFIHFERNRIAGFLGRLQEIVYLQFRLAWHGREGLRNRKFNASAANDLWSERMGPDWQHKINQGVDEFGQIVEYLGARNVQVVAILLPVGTAEDNLPFERAYIEAMSRVCRAKGIPLHDWSRRLSDEDLQDSSHTNVEGAEKIQPALLEIALPFLKSTGALK